MSPSVRSCFRPFRAWRRPRAEEARAFGPAVLLLEAERARVRLHYPM